MSKIRVDPLVVTVRYYENDIDPTLPLHQMEEPYYKAFPIQLSDDGTSRVTLVVEPPTIKEFKLLKKALKDIGVLSAEWRHHGKKEFIKL
jgi:hypothetical protein